MTKDTEALREALGLWLAYDSGNWQDNTTAMIAAYNEALEATKEALATPASDVVAVGDDERAAFIRLLDAADRFNGVYSCSDRVAGPYQGQMILAVKNAYRVLGIGRTKPHPPLAQSVDHVAGEALREALEALRPFADVAEEQDPDCTPIEERRADDDYVLYYPNWASGLEVGDLRRAKIAYDKLAALKGPAA